jgi:hypothetical protein
MYYKYPVQIASLCPLGVQGTLALAGVPGHISLASRQAAQSNIGPGGQYLALASRNACARQTNMKALKPTVAVTQSSAKRWTKH